MVRLHQADSRQQTETWSVYLRPSIFPSSASYQVVASCPKKVRPINQACSHILWISNCCPTPYEGFGISALKSAQFHWPQLNSLLQLRPPNPIAYRVVIHVLSSYSFFHSSRQFCRIRVLRSQRRFGGLLLPLTVEPSPLHRSRRPTTLETSSSGCRNRHRLSRSSSLRSTP